MISALAWVRKGAAAERPAAYEMTEDEYKRIQQIAATEISDAKQELKEKAQLDDAILNDPALKDFDLEHYDSDPSEDANDDQEESGPNVFSNIKGLAYHNEDEEDPYITMKGADEDEQEEVRVFGTDNLLLVAKTEDDMSNLEVCVFEDESDNLFVHHDFMLPAFPLCLEWLDYRVGRTAGQQTPGSFVAVGTFEPRIEIWDLDTLDSMYPDLVLGSTDKRQLRKLKGKPHAEFHTDAVMDLSWNRNVRNLLASSSADTTVKLWDLNTGKCAQSYGHHSDKVQAVKWHPTEASVMLSGGYDQKVAAFDSRAPDAITWWSSGSDVESLMWDIHSPSNFFVATDAGEVRYHDIRQPGSAVFVLAAHDEAVSAMDQHPSVPNVLVTGSVDQSVKVWTTKDNKPSMVLSRNLDVG
ncbi:rRNA-processing protein, partial [Linderina macrospora]